MQNGTCYSCLPLSTFKVKHIMDPGGAYAVHQSHEVRCDGIRVPVFNGSSICHTRCSCNALYNWNANETHKHVLVADFQESFLNVLYKEKAK